MRTSPRSLPAALSLAVLALSAVSPARAADAPTDPAAQQREEQVVVPEVERRDLRLPRYPSNDFEFGLYGGGFNTQNFGTSGTIGGRLGYHITEDWFTEATYGQVKVSDAEFHRILPGGVLNREIERMQTYDVSVGYNVYAGEAFFGTHTAKLTTAFVEGGIGNTVFDGQRMQTWVYGVGTALYFNDHFGVRVDARNHLYHMDLLGARQLQQNYELTLGASVLF